MSRIRLQDTIGSFKAGEMMEKIIINKIKYTDAHALFEFEKTNQTFFELMVPPRDGEYYNYQHFKKIHQSLLNEQENGLSYFFLIRDLTDSIVGRINLVDINQEERIGHLGYRIGQDHVGKGIASQAVSLLIKEAKQLGINCIKAKTTSNNIASQKVMEKNHFTYLSADQCFFEMNGEQVYFVYYQWDGN